MSNNDHTAFLIRLRHVSRRFGPFVALDDLSLDLPRGAFIAVVGRSGSGKSTLLNIIAGLDPASSGSVEVAGTTIDNLGEDALSLWRGRHVGVVFQSFQLLPTLTIAENVALPMDYCGTLRPAQARVRALSLLANVGIADQADKLPSALSGGQQQRAAIARALANDPALIVADEPTGNLDAQTATIVLDLLIGLARAGRTVVIVTHDAKIAASADRVVSLSDGRIVTEVGHAA